MLRRPAIFTYLIIALNLCLAYALAQHQFSPQTILQWGGMSAHMPTQQNLNQLPPFTTGYVKPTNDTRVISGFTLLLIRALWASCLHFSWQHVGSNMLTFYILGRGFEHQNHFGLLPLVYIITGIFSMVMALIFNPNVITAGASGAIFGLMGVCIIMGCRARKAVNQQRMEPLLGQNVMRLGGYALSLGVINLVYSFTLPHISITAHVAGLVSGLVLGFFLPMKKTY